MSVSISLNGGRLPAAVADDELSKLAASMEQDRSSVPAPDGQFTYDDVSPGDF